jgi:hypothetical protein
MGNTFGPKGLSSQVAQGPAQAFRHRLKINLDWQHEPDPANPAKLKSASRLCLTAPHAWTSNIAISNVSEPTEKKCGGWVTLLKLFAAQAEQTVTPTFPDGEKS